jgi:hypothetical protein
MKTKIIFTLLFILFGFSQLVQSQEIIYLKSGEELKVNIISKTPTSVKYKPFEDPNAEAIELDKDKISKIKYKDGYEENIVKLVEDADPTMVDTGGVYSTGGSRYGILISPIAFFQRKIYLDFRYYPDGFKQCFGINTRLWPFQTYTHHQVGAYYYHFIYKSRVSRYKFGTFNLGSAGTAVFVGPDLQLYKYKDGYGQEFAAFLPTIDIGFLFQTSKGLSFSAYVGAGYGSTLRNKTTTYGFYESPMPFKNSKTFDILIGYRF